jgi:serine/threonine protein kinase
LGCELFDVICEKVSLYPLRVVVSRLIAKGCFSEDESRVIVASIAEAVFICHQHGIVHRDLKVRSRMMAKNTYVFYGEFFLQHLFVY